MTGLLMNGTIGSPATSSSNSSYGFPSSSFTHQKQLNMPNDQKAKLLAMHRDGKANAGIYVAVVLFVYFILVILLLCRYGKRRRRAEPGLDSTTEQGHLHLLNFHMGRVVTCGGDGCYNCLSHFSFCTRSCQQMEGSRKPVVGQTLEDTGREGKLAPITVKAASDQADQSRISEIATVDKMSRSADCGKLSEELKEEQSGTTLIDAQEFHRQNEDSENEESGEED